MKKIIPYLKWILGIAGLIIAIQTSNRIMDVYIEKDLVTYVKENGSEPSREIRDKLRKESIEEAGVQIFIFLFGVMASCAWLVFPKSKSKQ